jgi:prepilin-type N-terminal cleavage/methylation domain-containing protein
LIMRTRKGFTLIELLVVIAIIAILAAILFPVFSTAKRRAQYSACSSNTSQWLKAMQMYMVDSNDRFPIACASDGFTHKTTCTGVVCPYGSQPALYKVLKKYTSGNEGIKWCQASVLANGKGGGWSYWYQCRWSWDKFDSVNPMASLCGTSSSEVKYPSRSPAIGDVNRCHEGSLKSVASGSKQTYIFPIGYCDGHVRDVTMVEADENKHWYYGTDGSKSKK